MHQTMISPNAFEGTDSERIAQAVAAAAATSGRVRIPRVNDARKNNLWLIDEAITLPSNITLELDGCRVKLSDTCRDNIIRSANSGIGITSILPARNIHIVGKNGATLEGADHPRATGDSGKTLTSQKGKHYPLTYGTDADKPNENQKGDWRNIGILMTSVELFSIEGVRIVNSHCWAISLEWCAYGSIRDISFSSDDGIMIDGEHTNALNQDGLDLRIGCHDIIIENITGHTGDDLIALTAIPHAHAVTGDVNSTELSASRTPESPCPDVHNIVIRNVSGYSTGGHHIVRFLNTSGVTMHDILLDGLIDSSPDNITCRAAVKIGDNNPNWGGVTPLGDTSRFVIRNVMSRCHTGVLVAGSLSESIIDGLIQDGSRGQAIVLESGEKYVHHVRMSNILPEEK